MRHERIPIETPGISWALLILCISHAIVFGWGVLIGAWVW